VILNLAEDLTPIVGEKLHYQEHREYSSRGDWMIRSNVGEVLVPRGYLEVATMISHDSPHREADHYLVNLIVSVDSGPQYRISELSADGGPLLAGKDLRPFFSQKVGDIAGGEPFSKLAGSLRALYWHYGYADLEVKAPPVFDRVHGSVAYHLSVIPGPIYHLRALTVHNLNPADEENVRGLLGMEPGDVFDDLAINALYQKLKSQPSLSTMSFTFSPTKDRGSAAVDLTLDFYKVSDKSSVTIR
jgi:outer membrane protein assembly factor BamA